MASRPRKCYIIGIIGFVLMSEIYGLPNLALTMETEQKAASLANSKQQQQQQQAQQQQQDIAAITNFNSVPHDRLDSSNNLNSNPLGDLGANKPYRIVKRAPNGFTGMRGKKDYETGPAMDAANDLEWNYNILPDDADELNLNDDRFDYANGDRLKKAPTAFYGMRGKKYMGNGGAIGFERLDRFLEKFEEERMREALLQDIVDRIAGQTDNELISVNSEMSKRAPIGFTGMRGKRPFYENDVNADELDKRVPSNAFIGVRGKKDVSHQTFKRSPMDSPRFFEFGNKFVAVRGKKNYNEQEEAPPATRRGFFFNIPLSEPQLRYLFGGAFYGDDGWSNGKRAPIGFTGMRG